MEAYEKGVNIDVELINATTSDKVFLVRIKKRERPSRNGVQVQYTVMSLALEEDVQNSTPSSSVNIPVDNHNIAESPSRNPVSRSLFPQDILEQSSTQEQPPTSSQVPDE
ncbi:hypothetical protein ACJIZ3_013270 [Penstemon smallii]|uniref:Uncharacterized protein n=1 Tax=Penstemon smallii TaxID=265156 RepID=A0ABD3UTD2_9LAMI